MEDAKSAKKELLRRLSSTKPVKNVSRALPTVMLVFLILNALLPDVTFHSFLVIRASVKNVSKVHGTKEKIALVLGAAFHVAVIVANVLVLTPVSAALKKQSWRTGSA